jgi:hypothetical protein
VQAVHSTRAVFLALVVVFLCVVAPATAAKFDAQNAKRVDGVKATKYTTSAKKRKGRLVATNKKGLLPNNIVGLVAAATHAKNADSAAALSCSGCVSAGQFASSNSPAGGQVLGFNSGSLAWQDASASGAAGGALAGTYPNPTLNVSGGPCPNGKALTNVSALAALTCATGVYSDGSGNVAVQANPFASLTSGFSDTAVGDGALSAVTTGCCDSAFGRNALALNTGDRNTAVGEGALSANTSGSDNTAVGKSALVNTTGAAGSRNSGLGEEALRDNVGGSQNSAVGYQALSSNTSGTQNSAFGSGALAVDQTGGTNAAFGQNALHVSTVGGDSAFGQNALAANTTGTANSAFGKGALAANMTGPSNTAVGNNALAANNPGDSNTAVGDSALDANTVGTDNSAVGASALTNETNANFDTALGHLALEDVTTGDANDAVGDAALANVTSGHHNTAIGDSAGASLTIADSSNIDVGAFGVTGDNNTTRIGVDGTGNGQQNKAFMAGVFEQNVTGAGTSAVNVNTTTGQLGIAVSSHRFKRDIRRLGPRSGRLMALRPVSFRYKRRYANGATARQYGLIAEQVARVDPNLVTYGRNGKPLTVAYQELPALELAQLQHQHAQLRRQRSRNRAQDKEIATLRRAVMRLSRNG